MDNELENLKNENARLSKLVGILQDQVKALELQIRLYRELASKQEFNPISQMQISQQERDFLTLQNISMQMNAFSKRN